MPGERKELLGTIAQMYEGCEKQPGEGQWYWTVMARVTGAVEEESTLLNHQCETSCERRRPPPQYVRSVISSSEG